MGVGLYIFACMMYIIISVVYNYNIITELCEAICNFILIIIIINYIGATTELHMFRTMQ